MLTEPNLEQFLVNTVGVYYSPEPLTYKEWLGQIADRLRQQAAAIDNGSRSGGGPPWPRSPTHWLF